MPPTNFTKQKKDLLEAIKADDSKAIEKAVRNIRKNTTLISFLKNARINKPFQYFIFGKCAELNLLNTIWKRGAEETSAYYYEKARDAFNDAIKEAETALDELYYELYYMQGLALFNLGQYEAAVDAFIAGINKESPEKAKILNRIAQEDDVDYGALAY